jgi:hypothetical protein
MKDVGNSNGAGLKQHGGYGARGAWPAYVTPRLAASRPGPMT